MRRCYQSQQSLLNILDRHHLQMEHILGIPEANGYIDVIKHQSNSILQSYYLCKKSVLYFNPHEQHYTGENIPPL